MERGEEEMIEVVQRIAKDGQEYREQLTTQKQQFVSRVNQVTSFLK